MESTELKVIAITTDGASHNRKFFRMHRSSKDEIVSKAKMCMLMMIDACFFISDPPHLIKTTRNCFSDSDHVSKYSTRSM